MRIGHTELFVRDVQSAKKFYVDVLGFSVVAEPSNGRVAWLALGTRELLLRPGNPPGNGTNYPQARSGIVLYTDDLAAMIERLTGRGLKITGADSDGCAAFTDPDGNWFQIVNPADHG
jgi:catechol 2,3-dioxygenase-like lactoylglutathione lyase family enzyme